MTEILPIIAVGLSAIVLIVQMVILFKLSKRGNEGLSANAFRRESTQFFGTLSDDIKKSQRTETDILKGAIAAGFTEQRKEQTESLSSTRRELSDNFERISKTVEAKLKDIQESNKTKLDEMQKVVDEKLHKALETRLTESFKTVSDQLEQVHKGLGEMQGLAQNVGDLKNVLTNVKTRGTYGEIQLERLLEEVFPPELYEKNFATRGTSERVEFALKLPGKTGDRPVYLPIDSKFPNEDYARLLDAYESGNKVGIAESQRSIEGFIKKSARDIKEKYLEPPMTTDFGLMFLPTEGLYAEVLRIPGLVEHIQANSNVTVAGPTTLLALLNALQMGFKTLTIEKKSSEVWKILSAVKTEFSNYRDTLQKAQDRIRQAGDEVDKLVGARTNKIMKKLRDVETLQDHTQAASLLEIGEGDEAD